MGVLPPADLATPDAVNVSGLTGSAAAIGAGATAIINQAISAADQARKLEQFEQEKLGKAVARLAGRLSAQANTPPPAGGSPYKYLLHYELADVARFFGRAEQVNSLLPDLTCADSRCRFVVLHGEAGVGKTSLLQAGIAPALVAAQHLPLLVRVSTSPLVTRIKQTLLPDLGPTPVLEKAPLQEFLRQAASFLPEGKQIFVLLDQFEAFFEGSTEASQNFVDELARCLFDSDPQERWLISIRSPWLGHLSAFQPAIPQPFVNTDVLLPLSRSQALAAVVEPARASGLLLEEGLLSELIHDLGPDAIDPSRLQLVCHTLVERLGPGEERLTLASYNQIGRADGILRDYLDNVLSRNIPSADREPAWQLMAAIADRREGPATETGLVTHMKAYGGSEADTRRVLALLETNRLVRLREERYELASDTFLPRIRQWAAERASLEQARAEVRRQVNRVRGSALRGLLGGALGFSLAFMVAYSPQVVNSTLLGYITVLRAPPGAIAGLLLTLFVDVTLASYHGPRRRLRWPVGGIAGAGAFAMAVAFHAFLRLPDLSEWPRLAPAAVEGALWGFVAGAGAVWVMMGRRPLWLTLPAVTVACGFALWLGEWVGDAFQNATPRGLIAAGAIMPLCVLAAALLGRAPQRELQ